MIHFDANFVIAAVDPNSEPHQRAAAWLASGEELAVSALAWGEFQCGPSAGLLPDDEAMARQFITTIVHLTAAHAEHAARLFNATNRRSRSFSDCLIAACAIASGALLATVNTADFERFSEHGLQLA